MSSGFLTSAYHASSENTQETNQGSVTLVWFDAKMDLREDKDETIRHLRHINSHLQLHTDLQICTRFIQSISHDRILLISSGSCASNLCSHVAEYSNIDSIFLYCVKKHRYEQLADENAKIVGIYTTLESLCNGIRERIEILEKNVSVFNFFDQNQRSMKNLSKKSAEFLWFQLFKHVILRLPRNNQAKRQMIDVCRQHYRGNASQLEWIDRFEHDYRAEEAIRWYCKQSFVYKLVNRVLRSEDIDQLYVFRFFIGDLSDNLAREHRKILLSDERTLIVYRGVKLDCKELEELKKNMGKPISTNSYLSTSRRRSQALTFAKKLSRRTDTIPVLFQIECDIRELGERVIFADTSSFSEYPHEQEILFDLSVTFRLESIQQEESVPVIRMSVSNDGQTIMQDYLDETSRETDQTSVAIVLGRLMCNLGQYEKSQKYFARLLEETNEEDRAWIEFNIGRALYFKGDWKEARRYYDLAYARMMAAEPARIKDSTHVLNGIGVIHDQRGRYEKALDYYQRVLHIRMTHFASNELDIACALNNIGLLFYNQKRYEEALTYHRRALEIRKRCYQSDHLDIAYSLNNIGVVLHNQGDYDQALNCYQQVVDIQEKVCPSGHLDTSYSFNNIGAVLVAKGIHCKALKYYQKALTIQESQHSSPHVDVADSLNNIGATYEKMGEANIAVDFYQRARSIYLEVLPDGHPSRLKVDTSIHRVRAKCTWKLSSSAKDVFFP